MESKQKLNSRACSSRIVLCMRRACATQYQAYIEACQHHTKLSCNVLPFLTLHSVKKDPNVDSEDTPSHSDTPSIQSYSLRGVVCGCILILCKPHENEISNCISSPSVAFVVPPHHVACCRCCTTCHPAAPCRRRADACHRRHAACRRAVTY